MAIAICRQALIKHTHIKGGCTGLSSPLFISGCGLKLASFVLKAAYLILSQRHPLLPFLITSPNASQPPQPASHPFLAHHSLIEDELFCLSSSLGCRRWFFLSWLRRRCWVREALHHPDILGAHHRFNLTPADDEAAVAFRGRLRASLRQGPAPAAVFLSLFSFHELPHVWCLKHPFLTPQLGQSCSLACAFLLGDFAGVMGAS